MEVWPDPQVALDLVNSMQFLLEILGSSFGSMTIGKQGGTFSHVELQVMPFSNV